MMIRCKIEENELQVLPGFRHRRRRITRASQSYRAKERSDPVHGTWSDSEEIAFASKEYDGFTSVYVGTGPMPVELLRWIAARAGVRLWSSEPDNVRATKDAAMLVATDEGERTSQASASDGSGGRRRGSDRAQGVDGVRRGEAVCDKGIGCLAPARRGTTSDFTMESPTISKCIALRVTVVEITK